MTTENDRRNPDNRDGTLHHKVPRVCLACHAERLGYPVTPKDCLGFAACETCTKVPIPEDGNFPDVLIDDSRHS